MPWRTRIRQAAFPAALTLAALLGALHLGITPVRQLNAQDVGCGNSRCVGFSYCQYANGEECSFPERGACLTRRCRFIRTPGAGL